MFLYGNNSGNYQTKLLLQAKFAIIEISYVYFILYYLMPKFLLEKKTLTFITVFILTFPLVLLLENLAMAFPNYNNISIDKLYRSITTSSFYWLALENLFVIILAFSIKFLKSWYVSQKEKDILERKNIESELNLLKMQINPHFLFNTLNNINSLVFIDQQKTYDSIIKLSEMLRYLTYETKSDKVLFKNELKMISNYIELQRIRFKHDNFIKFSIEGKTGKERLAPMLFIPFIENTFKYCKKKPDKLPGVKISFKIKNNQIHFHTTNYFHPKKDEPETGIGIENVKKRLSLMYPNRHKLYIRQQKHIFSVFLIIQITQDANN